MNSMTKEEALLEYQQYFNMDNENERRLFEETTNRLKRVTRASDIAAAVGMLYGVSGINCNVVKSGAFILPLITIAENLKGGTSINNVRDHIKNVIARNEWEKRDRQEAERREQEGRRFRIEGKTVTVNCAISFDRDKFELFKTIVSQLNATLSEVDILCTADAVYLADIAFPSDGFTTANPKYQYFQIDGNAASVAEVLHRVHDEIGASYISDISYQTHDAMGIEHSRLTLTQAIQLADDEAECCLENEMEEAAGRL